MKTLITLCMMILFISFAGWSQDNLKEVKARVGNPEILKNWNVGQEKVIEGAKIIRIEGENSRFGRTNILFTPYERKETIRLVNAQGGGVMNEEIAGGRLALFFDRESESHANAGNMIVTVTNIYETQVICRKTLTEEAPRPYIQGIWYNFQTIDLTGLPEGSFMVKIEDVALNQEFKFKVNVIENPGKIEKPAQAAVMSAK